MPSIPALAVTACVAVAALLSPLRATAADATWPARPVRIIVAQAPGGPPDLIGRYVAEKLSRSLGSPVIVDNRPGASGIIGIDQAARATPDGHTLVIATLSTHALVPHIAANVPYDPLRDFVPVSNLFRSRSGAGVARVRRWSAVGRPDRSSPRRGPADRALSTGVVPRPGERVASEPALGRAVARPEAVRGDAAGPLQSRSSPRPESHFPGSLTSGNLSNSML